MSEKPPFSLHLPQRIAHDRFMVSYELPNHLRCVADDEHVFRIAVVGAGREVVAAGDDDCAVDHDVFVVLKSPAMPRADFNAGIDQFQRPAGFQTRLRVIHQEKNADPAIVRANDGGRDVGMAERERGDVERMLGVVDRLDDDRRDRVSGGKVGFDGDWRAVCRASDRLSGRRWPCDRPLGKGETCEQCDEKRDAPESMIGRHYKRISTKKAHTMERMCFRVISTTMN